MSEMQYGMKFTGDMFKDWWAKLIVGILLIGFGFFCFLWPDMVLFTAIVLFGGLCVFSGIMFMLSGLSGQVADKFKWMALAEGAVLFILGLMTFFWPGLTALALLLVFGLFAVLIGGFRILDWAFMPQELRPMFGKTARMLLLVSGVFSVIIGLIIMFFPQPSLLAILWLVGAYAIVFGAFMLAAAISSHKV